MSVKNMIIKKQKVFEGATNIDYLFLPSKKPSKYLVVGFSGFNGREAEGKKSTFNYINTLKDLHVNKLFINDDYAGVPCYYYGKNRHDDYAVSVATLIYKIANENNIQGENIITFGSSKGGSAALYIGLKFNFGHVIAGAFQTKPADYLLRINKVVKDKMLQLMAGSTDEEAAQFIDDTYLSTLKVKETKANLYFHGGTGDSHYRRYMLPLLKYYDEEKVNYSLDLQNYDSHADVIHFFPQFLINQLKSICGNMEITKTNLKHENNKLLLVITNDVEEKDTEYAYYVYKEDTNEILHKAFYSKNTYFNYKLSKKGRYRIKTFIKNKVSKYAVLSNRVEV